MSEKNKKLGTDSITLATIILADGADYLKNSRRHPKMGAAK